ncbi:MAG: hypothetical protein AAF685_01345 [Cyanobacteria bacterium P01_C01_bin.89]
MALPIIIGGLITSFIFSVIVLGSWVLAPEAWLSDLTEGRIKSPKNRKTYIVFLSVLTTILAGPIITAWWVGSMQDASFYERSLAAWLVVVILNLVDLIVIDIVIYMWFYPSWMQVEGIEPLHQLWPHTKGALIGCSVLGVPIALIAAGITTFA